MLAHGFPAVRYADDFVVAAHNRAEADAALSTIRKEAAALSLELADEKTEVVEFAEGFVFLGEDVNHRYPEELPNELRPVPDKRTLYVGRQGSSVRLWKGHIVVHDRESTLIEVPVALVAHLVVFGSVLVTPAVIAEASGRVGRSCSCPVMAGCMVGSMVLIRRVRHCAGVSIERVMMKR